MTPNCARIANIFWQRSYNTIAKTTKAPSLSA